MLAHRAWVPLARLSFGAYLLHPLVINLWFLNATAKVGDRFAGRPVLIGFALSSLSSAVCRPVSPALLRSPEDL